MVKLRPGDKVAILSPASIIDPRYIDGAVATLREWGFVPEVMPHALGESGSFSGTVEERLSDFRTAMLDPDIKAIICSRGGYGCVHLLRDLDRLIAMREVAEKWIVGFSDVSALHALWGKYGWQSIHASMTKHLTLGGPNDSLNLKLLSMLRGETDEVTLSTGFSGSVAGKRNHQGCCSGRIVGGNLAVLGGLIGTQYNQIEPGSILLIEDIAEPIYKVERILWQLRLAGIFSKLSGLIVGQFTEYRAPTRDHVDVYSMIDSFLESSPNIPVAMDVAVGHIDQNEPLLLNRQAQLEVTATKAIIRYR